MKSSCHEFFPRVHIDEDCANYVQNVWLWCLYILLSVSCHLTSIECVPVTLITCNNYATLTTFVALVGTLNWSSTISAWSTCFSRCNIELKIPERRYFDLATCLGLAIVVESRTTTEEVGYSCSPMSSGEQAPQWTAPNFYTSWWPNLAKQSIAAHGKMFWLVSLRLICFHE